MVGGGTGTRQNGEGEREVEGSESQQGIGVVGHAGSRHRWGRRREARWASLAAAAAVP